LCEVAASRTAGCGTACPVVWEDGSRKAPSYPIGRKDFVQLNSTDNLLLSCLLPVEASVARLRQLLGALPNRIDWAAAVHRADAHHIASLLRFSLARAGAINSLPQETQDQLRNISQTWAARHLAYVSEATRLVAALAGEGIEAIPLKGAALMLGGYYPQAGLRAATDIDLLVDPARIEDADRIVEADGYVHLPGKRSARPRQRLANEVNHLWPRRGPGGIILELHHRAFQFARRERDFSFAEVRSRATFQSTAAGQTTASGFPLLLPSPTDLAFHLVHHTLVDLQTTRAILRTVADLHFIFARHPEACEGMQRLADEFGFGGAARLASDLERLLANSTLAGLDEAMTDERIALWIETALIEDALPLADAARMFEYFDFARHPVAKLGNLFSLLFTSREHLAQLYGHSKKGAEQGPAQGDIYWNYLRRPFDLVRKFNRAGLSPANLRRVWRLRRLR
ncbi:MAG: nucleotidyltransferase family protein, partial [Acidobacteriota bacterium]|nr:nucleotidyltransferase family protein [Acidobacteriota bacterium]